MYSTQILLIKWFFVPLLMRLILGVLACNICHVSLLWKERNRRCHLVYLASMISIQGIYQQNIFVKFMIWIIAKHQCFVCYKKVLCLSTLNFSTIFTCKDSVYVFYRKFIITFFKSRLQVYVILWLRINKTKKNNLALQNKIWR